MNMRYPAFILTFLLALAPAHAQNTLFPANPGDMIVRGTHAWNAVPGGTAGCPLLSNGPAAAATWNCVLPLNVTLPPMAPNTVWGNMTAAQAAPTAASVSQFLNTIDFDIQRPPLPGAVIYKGTDNLWHTAPPAAAGWVWTSQGAGAIPQWQLPNIATVGGVTITPTPGTTNRGLTITQTGPSSGSATGPIAYNLVSASSAFTNSSTGTDAFGVKNSTVAAWRTNFTIGGADLVGEPHAAGFFSIADTIAGAQPGGGPDKIALVGTIYSTVASKGLYGIVPYAMIGAGGTGDNLIGIESDVGIDGSASSVQRIAFRATAHPNLVTNTGKRATTVDAAFSVTNGGIPANSFKHVIALQATDFVGIPLNTDSDILWSDGALTIGSVLNIPNVTVNDYILNSPNITITGAGALSTSGVITQTVNQDGNNWLRLINTSAGTSAASFLSLASNVADAAFGLGGGNYTGIALLQNRAYAYAGAGSDGLVLYATGLKSAIVANNGVESTRTARISDATTFGVLSFNGVVTSAGYVGVAGGGDTLLYLQGGAGGVQVKAAGADLAKFSPAGGLGIGTTSDPGAGLIYLNSASFLMRNKTSWTNGAGALTGTLTNAPAVGNPTKWIPVDDNGTTRYIPAW